MDESISELGKVIKIDDGRIKNHLNEVVRSTVEETLNVLPGKQGKQGTLLTLLI